MNRHIDCITVPLESLSTEDGLYAAFSITRPAGIVGVGTMKLMLLGGGGYETAFCVAATRAGPGQLYNDFRFLVVGFLE